MSLVRLLPIWFALLPSLAAADWDYSYAAGGRSFPTGASVSATGGYGRMLWGPNPLEWLPRNGPAPVLGDWRFGYVRAHGNVQTVGISNRAQAELEFFPVSILGFGVGHGYHVRLADNPNYDCLLETCRGTLSRDHARAQLIVGAKGVFLLAQARYEWFRNRRDERAFVEEVSALVSAGPSDRLRTLQLTLGYLPAPGWVLSANHTHQRFLADPARGGEAWNTGVAASRFFGPWGVTAAVSRYESRALGTSASFAVLTSWVGQRAISLF